LSRPWLSKKRAKKRERKVHRAARRRAPDRPGHRRHVAHAQRHRVATALQKLAERDVGQVVVDQPLLDVLVQPQHRQQHPDVRRREHQQRLGEDLGQVFVASPFDAAVLDADAERHVGVLPRHADVVEEAVEVRVIDRVADDEAGVDRQRAGLRVLNVDGVGVPADPGGCFEKAHVVALAQVMRCAEPRDAATDNRDLHVIF